MYKVPWKSCAAYCSRESLCKGCVFALLSPPPPPQDTQHLLRHCFLTMSYQMGFRLLGKLRICFCNETETDQELWRCQCNWKVQTAGASMHVICRHLNACTRHPVITQTLLYRARLVQCSGTSRLQ